jgi:hypothetical protein
MRSSTGSARTEISPRRPSVATSPRPTRRPKRTTGEAIQTEERKIREQADMAEKALFETPYPIVADEVEKARYLPLRRGAYEGVYGSLFLLEGEEAREELERLLTRAERTQDPELADAYLEKKPKAKKRWEEYAAAKQEANSLNRKLGLTMDFGLVKPAELIG